MLWLGIGIGFLSFPVAFVIAEVTWDLWRTRR
jgi:hypothetical protein